jgi:hypothetical protein
MLNAFRLSRVTKQVDIYGFPNNGKTHVSAYVTAVMAVRTIENDNQVPTVIVNTPDYNLPNYLKALAPYHTHFQRGVDYVALVNKICKINVAIPFLKLSETQIPTGNTKHCIIVQDEFTNGIQAEFDEISGYVNSINLPKSSLDVNFGKTYFELLCKQTGTYTGVMPLVAHALETPLQGPGKILVFGLKLAPVIEGEDKAKYILTVIELDFSDLTGDTDYKEYHLLSDDNYPSLINELITADSYPCTKNEIGTV